MKHPSLLALSLALQWWKNPEQTDNSIQQDLENFEPL
jgi:hypothetical protein